MARKITVTTPVNTPLPRTPVRTLDVDYSMTSRRTRVNGRTVILPPPGFGELWTGSNR